MNEQLEGLREMLEGGLVTKEEGMNTMKEFIEKLIGEIYNEQLRYNEYSREYQELDSLVQLLKEWLAKNN